MSKSPTRSGAQKLRTMSIGGATFDLFMRIDHAKLPHDYPEEIFALPLGAKVKVDGVIGTCGGGACNTAVGLSRLGLSAGFSGILADDQWGAQLQKNFEKEHIDTTCVTFVEEETSSFSLILSGRTGERVILYDPGTNAHLHDVTFDRETAGKVDWVYLNHIQPGSSEIEDDLIAIFTAEPHPCLTWNPGGAQIEAGIRSENNKILLKHTSLLLLNKEEAISFSHTKSVTEALKVLSACGVGIVCITDGKRGSTATDGKQVWHCPSPETNVIDTTGAGDAFGTGITWGLATGKDLPKSLQAGTINAMSVVGAIGAQAGLLTETEMNSKLASLKIPLEVSSL
jgi:sugar/nucleoside kinase (ribokinase family)